MVMFSRSTKPLPRHQPRIEALEERLALSVGTPILPFALHSPAAIGKTQTVPFKGYTDYTRDGTNADGFPIFVGKGISTIVGRFTSTATVNTSHNPEYYSADVVLKAPNGDEIYVHADQIFYDPFPFKAHGIATITGGTGRFAHASGQVDVTDTFALDPTGTQISSDQQTFEGSISF